MPNITLQRSGGLALLARRPLTASVRRREDDSKAPTTGDYAETVALPHESALSVVSKAKDLRTSFVLGGGGSLRQPRSKVSGPDRRMEGVLALHWPGAHDGGVGRDREKYIVVEIVRDNRAGQYACASARHGVCAHSSTAASKARKADPRKEREAPDVNARLALQSNGPLTRMRSPRPLTASVMRLESASVQT